MTGTLVEWADVILTMTAAQRDWILHAFPEAEGKVMRVSEYSGTAIDVEDPYGGDRAEYARCADFLSALIPGTLVRLDASSEEHA